ncbi:hypothetical protein FOZ63_023712, partial [Perkinsus olseni]
HKQDSSRPLRHGAGPDAGTTQTAASSDSSGGAASTVADSRSDVYNEIKEAEDDMDISSFSQTHPMPAAGDPSLMPSRHHAPGRGNGRSAHGSFYRLGVGLPPRQPTHNRRPQPREVAARQQALGR